MTPDRPARGPENDRRMLRRLLRDLPPRRAPATLESRVLRELERRAALAWWRRGFAHWPLAARASFVVLCGALIGITLLGGSSWTPPDAAAALSWSHPALAALGSVGSAGGWIVRLLPDGWLVGMGAAMAALYAILFGLGAAAYSTLYRHDSRAPPL